MSIRLASLRPWEAVSFQARLCVAPSFCHHMCLCLLQWAWGGDTRPLQLPEQERKLSLGQVSCQGMLAALGGACRGPGKPLPLSPFQRAWWEVASASREGRVVCLSLALL